MIKFLYALITRNSFCTKESFVKETYILKSRYQLPESIELKYLSEKKKVKYLKCATNGCLCTESYISYFIMDCNGKKLTYVYFQFAKQFYMYSVHYFF